MVENNKKIRLGAAKRTVAKLEAEWTWTCEKGGNVGESVLEVE